MRGALLFCGGVNVCVFVGWLGGVSGFCVDSAEGGKGGEGAKGRRT